MLHLKNQLTIFIFTLYISNRDKQRKIYLMRIHQLDLYMIDDARHITNLDGLNDDDRLEEREEESTEPIHGLLPSPLHTVQDREESRPYYSQYTDCVHRGLKIIFQQ